MDYLQTVRYKMLGHMRIDRRENVVQKIDVGALVARTRERDSRLSKQKGGSLHVNLGYQLKGACTQSAPRVNHHTSARWQHARARAILA